MTFLKEVYQPKRHLFAISIGIIAGFLPSIKSNLHPLFLGAIFAILFTKLLFGDYDSGFQFSGSDILFFILCSLEGVLGAWIAQQTL
jgi:hypothetical protein